MGMNMGSLLVFYALFCKPVDVVEGIALRACYSDGGVSNVGVGGGWLFSKGIGMFITDSIGVGLYFEIVEGRWWLADCFSNGLKDISLDVVAMEIRETLLKRVIWQMPFLCFVRYIYPRNIPPPLATPSSEWD